LAVLYVAFGILDWQDVDGTEMVSPLLLVPVQLIPEGPKGTPRITEGENDPVINPALSLRLKEFGIELPTSEEVEELPVTETLAAIRQALEKHRSFAGWRLREATYLGIFSFAKEAMFKDLADNEAKILEHPIVRALATSDSSEQSAEFLFDAIDPAEIDTTAPPEVTPLILDADSSQRAAVAAGLAGKTFVMDGPPGTGKSQTIANMIGALLHAGKSVLFVSEKIAALDVVRNRLVDVGLGSYVLEMHSHKAKRKEVAVELLNTLDNIVKPPVAMPSLARHGAVERRAKLNDYAAAMNDVRAPLNLSLHHVLGVLAKLAAAPAAPVPESAPVDLSEAQYLAVRETLGRLVRAWRPAAQGRSFLWRDVVDDQSLEVRLYQAQAALEELRGTVALNSGLAEAFGFRRPSDAPRLAELSEHQSQPESDKVLAHWLTVGDVEQLQTKRAELGRQLNALEQSQAIVLQTAGVSWDSLPDPADIPEPPEAISVSPSPVDIQRVPASELAAAADRFESEAKLLSDTLASVSGLAKSFGMPEVGTFSDIDRLGRLVDLAAQDTRLDRRWFSSGGLAEARSAADLLRERARELAAAEHKASSVFSPEALKAPVAELEDRFTNLHKGLKKLTGNYRADKKTVAALLNNAADVKAGISHLSEAVSWGEANDAFAALADSRGDLLGTYWDGRATQFDDLNAAFRVVEEVLGLTNGAPPYELVSFMTGSDDGVAERAVANTARNEIGRWKEGLQAAPALTGRPDLVMGTVEAAVDWLNAHVLPMRQAVRRASSIGEVTDIDHTLEQANHVIALTSDARGTRDALAASEQIYRATFGDHFDFGATDTRTLDEALAWAMELRRMANGPLSPAQVKALEDSNVVPATVPAYQKWAQTRDRVIDAFAPGRRAELSEEFDGYEDAIQLVSEFRDDTVGQQEWFDYQRAYAELRQLGLDTAVDFCVEHHLAPSDVPDVVNRALLRAWSDAVIQRDSRLRPTSASDRDALVDEYRNLDRALVQAATADIISSANTRRPVNTIMGESSVIRREGSKQKRHKPVRELMALTRHVTPSIKPVFMMSPLAVSQYLPSDMEFDVVIFDEASQVTPGDAINCIYRGKALILAGDDKQLPPTSFFERNRDDEEDEDTDVTDFKSVLELAKACGAFNNLGLRWHYRSRHEGLIGFSNYKFYDGKLVTFPSAHAEGDDVGVEFFNARGTYRRGGGANNPIEAAKVAERVMEHFTNRPDSTLGVVTFSVAQADAVQDAIDEARVGRRDLDRFFDSEDRLDGFFIRALEQVQGDERDVIIFSIGYGPDEAGKITTNFGALNKDKGWRRLNVGITRARQRVEVVASMHAGQIPPSMNENVEYLRQYMDYAEKGMKVLAVPQSSTGLDPESPFEESVLETIRNWGYAVEPQVGAAGFRIDIGVRHPAYPGTFAIGVECDGYQYHSAPAARDRDRLRDQILSGLGWRLHRIWGTAWYRDRSTEEGRLRSAIDDAIQAPLNDRIQRVPSIERLAVETESAAETGAPSWTSEYRIAPVHQLPRWVDPGEPGNHLHMVDGLEALVDAEGPIHLGVAYERLRGWWRVGRIGPNIRTNIDLALQRAQVVRDGDFLTVPGADVTQVRTPADGVDRKAEHVHLEELAMAAVLTIRDVGAVSRSELAPAVARIFGWSRSGPSVTQRVNDAIDRLIAEGEVKCSNDETLTLARESD